MPTLNLRAAVQSHPFIIASWTESDPIYIELLIKPENGFTNNLWDVAIKYKNPEEGEISDHEYPAKSWMIWYSGPYGNPESIDDYGSVLMIATDFGVAAYMPILQELIRGYEKCRVRTRRVHLVWQLVTWG